MVTQLRIPGFPEGSIAINSVVSVLTKDGRVTYFIGSDNYFSHMESESSGQRFAIAALMANGHVKAVEVERSVLAIPHRTLMNWGKQLADKGADSFFAPPTRSGARVMTPEILSECARLLGEGHPIAETARRAGVDVSTLSKAKHRGALIIPRQTNAAVTANDGAAATTKSSRTTEDALAAAGMGTACTRADERMAAAVGLLDSARTHYEHCQDVVMGGVLAGLPALCANGLLSGLGKHFSLPKGYYSALHILMTMGFMALARIRRPENLRHVPSGEMGKVVGLDRVPEVRTLRKKVALLAETGSPDAWMKELSGQWMQADPNEAGYLYVDGHVRVYHGSDAKLPRRYVSREKLCLHGTTDYWVNDAVGRPFFVVTKAVTDGLASTLLQEIVPELLQSVPGQPSEAELLADPLLHRFVIIFDREGSTHSLLSQLWQQRIGAITYRKAVKDVWPESEFQEVEVPVPGGGKTMMKLASRETSLSAGQSSMPVLEVRRLTETSHQTAIISTARLLLQPVIAGRMFSRWCQENFFAYMMEHYDIDGLVQYGSEALPGTTLVVNPAWRTLEKSVHDHRRCLVNFRAKCGKKAMENDPECIDTCAIQVQSIQQLQVDLAELYAQRRATPRKVTIDSLPEHERPSQLLPLRKTLTDTVKMIAYRAETALVALVRKHLNKEAEARALIRELFVSSADTIPNELERTLTVRVHRMSSPVQDRAVAGLLQDLTLEKFCHPETGMRMIFELV